VTDKIYQALVGNDVDGVLYAVDVIRHDRKLWLVTGWLELPSLGVSRPIRIIRFDNRQHQRMPAALKQGMPEYILNGPVPKALLDGPARPQQAFSYEDVDAPEIDIPASVRPLHMGRVN